MHCQKNMKTFTIIKRSHKLTPLKSAHQNKSYSIINIKLAKK